MNQSTGMSFQATVRKNSFLNLLFITVFSFILTGQIVSAETFMVTSVKEFRQALQDAAGNGQSDTIALADGTYKTTEDSGGKFYFLDNEEYDLTIQGSSPQAVIISGGYGDRVLSFVITNSSTATIFLLNIAIIKGRSNQPGGGVYSAEKLVINNCIISDNVSDLCGGGIYSTDVTIKNSIITGNSCFDFGEYSGFTHGIAIYAEKAKILNSIIINNGNSIRNDGYNNDYSALWLTNGDQHQILNSVFINNTLFSIAGATQSVVATIYNNYIDESRIKITSFKKGNIHGGNLYFADIISNDFRIGRDSALIDAGTTDIGGLEISLTDIAGNQRVTGTTIDIGPYEFSTDDLTLEEKLAAEFERGRQYERKKWDINGDGIFGMEEVMYILQINAGIKN